jgi:hypothetical protein
MNMEGVASPVGASRTSGHKIVARGRRFFKELVMMTTVCPGGAAVSVYSAEAFAHTGKQKDRIKAIAEIIGISVSAIAGTVAEEYPPGFPGTTRYLNPRIAVDRYRPVFEYLENFLGP